MSGLGVVFQQTRNIISRHPALQSFDPGIKKVLVIIVIALRVKCLQVLL